jgi:F0F1-type ATP synthase delta subunit
MATFDEYLEALKVTIAENGDREALSAMEEAYGSRVALVTTARPLTGEAEHHVSKELERLGAVDGVRFVVDTALIGGVKIRLGEREVDRSIASRLQQFAG